jgi:hypothetical protein
MSPFIYDGLTPYARTESPLTLPPPPSMMHMPAMVPAPPHIFLPGELNVKTVNHTMHYPVHNPAAVSNWWPKPNYGPQRMNTNWNPHSLHSMMYTNHHAMTMNPYFMANPSAQLYAQYNMQMAGGVTDPNNVPGFGDLKYQGDGFENPAMNQLQGQQPEMNEGGEEGMDMGQGNEMII